MAERLSLHILKKRHGLLRCLDDGLALPPASKSRFARRADRM